MKYNSAGRNESPGRRAAAYWFADGLPEIAFGLVLLAIGLFGVWTAERGRLHRKDWWMWAGMIASPLLFVVMSTMHRRILDFLKARITYPRTGYVRPPIDFPSKSNSLDKILTLGTAVDKNVSSFRSHTVYLFVYGALFVQFLPMRWSLPLVMTAIAAVIHYWSRDDARQYSWRSVLPISLFGFIATGVNLVPMARAFFSLVIIGAWLLVIGTWTLVNYLRAHPKSDTGQESCP
jgi:hypothetical protein